MPRERNRWSVARLICPKPVPSRRGQHLNLVCFQSAAPWIRPHIEHDTITLAGQVLWRNAGAMKKMYRAVAIGLDATATVPFVK
jgi:hypothetical protein